MVQNGSKTNHLEHIGSLAPEIVPNDAERTAWTPSTNPSEGYVSFNQPLRGVCVFQTTPPKGMCSPVGTPSQGPFNQPFRYGGPGKKIKSGFTQGDTVAQARGHVRKVRDAHGRVG